MSMIRSKTSGLLAVKMARNGGQDGLDGQAASV